MNILIASDKSDVKLYEQIINSASNTSVLGAETTIKSDFIKKLKDKWHPHTVLIDTAVPIKNSTCKDIVSQIKDNYPYIKIIVMTDNEDTIEYNSDFCIKGQISNIEFIELLDKVRQSIAHNISTPETILNDDIGITEELNTGNGITEDLSKKDFKLPKTRKKTKVKIPKTKNKRKINTYLYAITGIAIVLFILIITLVFKACSTSPVNNTVASSDEVVSVIDTTSISESQITVSFTDVPTPLIETQEIVSNTISVSPTEETTEPTEKETKDNNEHVSDNGSQSSVTTNDNSSQANNSNYQHNTHNKEPEYSYNSSANKNVAVSNVQLSYSSNTLLVGNTLSLIATVSPSNATNKTVYWYSSNSAVATVYNGIVTAKSTGTTIITAKSGDKYASCSITVKSNNVTVKPTPKPTQKPTAQPTTKDPVSLSSTSYNIVVGQIINIYLNNSDGCSWSISSPSLVQICGGGSNKITLKGKKSGNTTVVATDTKTGKSYTCYVNVN